MNINMLDNTSPRESEQSFCIKIHPVEHFEAKVEKKKQRCLNLGPKWAEISKDYTPLKVIGQGSYGQVVRATCNTTGNKVAIKFIEHVDENEYNCVKTIREIQILRKLSKMSNLFVELIDLYQFTFDDKLNVFIVMEDFGHDLKNILT
jgi:serine/threonine protein kinase